MKKDKHIHADGTYKLIWQKHTLITAGTTDRAKAWHPFGVMPTKSEKGRDYYFFFRCVKKAVLQCYNVNYKPDVLVADAAGAITRGFMKAFGYRNISEFDRINCWQHVKRNIAKHINLVAKENRSSINADLAVLQESSSPKNFDAASKLFLNKWKNKEKTFIDYFQTQWLKESNVGWYQGFAVGVPDHNNAEEADNRYIKEGYFY